jgi:hypothetical protein
MTRHVPNFGMAGIHSTHIFHTLAREEGVSGVGRLRLPCWSSCIHETARKKQHVFAVMHHSFPGLSKDHLWAGRRGIWLPCSTTAGLAELAGKPTRTTPSTGEADSGYVPTLTSHGGRLVPIAWPVKYYYLASRDVRVNRRE